jgi:hypothetical protein
MLPDDGNAGGYVHREPIHNRILQCSPADGTVLPLE